MARTRWEDWYAEVDRAFDELRAQSDEIFVMGLSMGGCLALRLAEVRGAAVSGLVLVNPSVTADTKLFLLAPVLKLVVPSLKGIASDIKKDGSQRAWLRPHPGQGRGHPARAVEDHPAQPRPGHPAACWSTAAPTTTSSARPACEVLRKALPAGPARGPGAAGQLPCRDPRQRRADDLRGKPGVRQDAQPGWERIAIAAKGRKREGYDVSGEDAGRGDAGGGGVTGDEAAWRDLVARFSMPGRPGRGPVAGTRGPAGDPAHAELGDSRGRGRRPTLGAKPPADGSAAGPDDGRGAGPDDGRGAGPDDGLAAGRMMAAAEAGQRSWRGA